MTAWPQSDILMPKNSLEKPELPRMRTQITRRQTCPGFESCATLGLPSAGIPWFAHPESQEFQVLKKQDTRNTNSFAVPTRCRRETWISLETKVAHTLQKTTVAQHYFAIVCRRASPCLAVAYHATPLKTYVSNMEFCPHVASQAAD